MIEQVAGVRLTKIVLFGLAIVLGVIAVDYYAQRQGLSYKELIVALGALSATFIPGRKATAIPAQGTELTVSTILEASNR